MSPQWMPQNIQKRLLLYILQQLSFFSAIDLPNLEEVSLSNIHLKDVSIDPEKVGKLPGLNLRSGKLRNIELTGGVTGVNFTVSGVELVVAPSVDNLDDDLKQMQLLLAQSTANLANTVLLDGGDDDAHDSDTDLEFSVGSKNGRSGSTSSSSSRKSSTLGGMMSRAAEIALLRLVVNVSDIHIKFVSEPLDIMVHIASLLFRANNGLRSVDIGGVKVSVLKPHVSKGHQPDTDHQEVHTLSTNTSDDDEDDDDDDYVDESLMESMVFTEEEASSIYMSATSRSFANDGSGLSSSDSDTIMAFIDKISLTFEGLSLISDLKVDIGTINIGAVPLMPTASLAFNCISKMLKVKNHQLRKQNASLRRGRKRNSKFPQYDQAEDTLEDDESDEIDPSTPTFSHLHVSSFIVSLTSALGPTGEFVSTKDDISIDLRNFNMRQKDENLIYGGIETFTIKRFINGDELTLFAFTNPKAASEEPQLTSGSPPPSGSQAKADFRFELFENSADGHSQSEITALLSKTAKIQLDSGSLQYLVNFISSLLIVNDSMNEMLNDLKVMRGLNSDSPSNSPSSKASTADSSGLLLQTSFFNIHVDLAHSVRLKIVVFPMSYNKKQDKMTLQRIVLLTIVNNEEEPLLTIPNVSFKSNLQEFTHYSCRPSASAPRRSNILCSKTLSCGPIKGAINFDTLVSVKLALSEFLTIFLNHSLSINAMDSAVLSSPSNVASSTTAGSYTGSIYSSQTRFRRLKGPHTPSVSFGDQPTPTLASFRFTIKLVAFAVKSITKDFGDLDLDVDHFEVSQQAGGIQGFVHSIKATRRHEITKTIEPVFIKYEENSTGSPVALFASKSNDKGSSIDVVLRRFQTEYFATWQELLKKDAALEKVPETRKPVEDSIKPSTPGKRSEIRFAFHDFVIGLNPYRLKSKLCLSIDKGNMDFTLGREQFYAKSSFRELCLFLIDDVKYIKNDVASNSSQLSPVSFLNSSGFVMIGQINTLHLGITVNTDIDEIKRRNEHLGIRGDLSLVDLKINSDEHQIELCADSAHTLGQTVNDLKAPTVFKDEDKFKVTVDKEFEWPLEILDQIGVLHTGGLRTERNFPKEPESASVNTNKDADVSEFFIVDEYYTAANEHGKSIELGLSKLSLDSSSNSNNDSSSIVVVEDHFAEKSKRNKIEVYPFSFHMNLSKSKLFLYDGFDWKQTRKSLRKAVKKLEVRAKEAVERKLGKSANSNLNKNTLGQSDVDTNPVADTLSPSSGDGPSDDRIEAHDGMDFEEDVMSETLFQSIHVSLMDGTTPSELVANINSQVQYDSKNAGDDNAEIKLNIEKHYKELKLSRSKIHKVSVDLKNLEVSLTNYTTRDPRLSSAPSDLMFEKVNNIDVALDSITIYDNVPTSTWNKILTYMNILGEREIGTSMLRFNLSNVRPDPNLAYAEAIMHVSILPVRLYIDQDTLEFVTRFFEFRDSRFQLPVDEMVYIQKLVVDPLKLKFDYKPKKVDYSGLRSGNNAEFVNFFILDGSDIALKQVVVYGVPGFPKLGSALGKVYGPYIQKYQLAGLLSGLSPVRSIVNIGGGVKDLVAIPLSEYKKDGRLMRSLQKGTTSFAKTMTYELLKLGVKLASGTQVVLENLEEYFGGEGLTGRRPRKNISARKDEVLVKQKGANKKHGLLESSLLLKKNVEVDTDPYSSQKLYSASLNEVNEEDLDFDELQPSILIFDDASASGTPEVSNPDNQLSDEEEDNEYVEKMVSLYSNQPSNATEGFKSAFKSLGKNMKSTKKKLAGLKNELKDAENFQEQITSIAKSSPVIVIRPMIGTTEAVMKALMGISNGIDSRYMKESQDKYRNDKTLHSDN